MHDRLLAAVGERTYRHVGELTNTQGLIQAGGALTVDTHGQKLVNRDTAATDGLGIRGQGPVTLTLNGEPLAFATAANPYRAGAAVIAMEELRARLVPAGNTLVVTLR